ncbi:MAG: hypothetical protein LBU66_01085 [Treponema sp.]|jgi:hypothetical protein|nr:hypothetical protein [Treponema sp.]
MKNIIKFLGTYSRRIYAIALVAVIGFSMAACGDDNGDGNGGDVKAKLTVNNNYSAAITKVEVTNYGGTNFEDTTGVPSESSKTFTIKMKKPEDSGWWGLTLYEAGDNILGFKTINITNGKTTTVTLNSEGKIE